MRKIDECELEKFSALDYSDKAIAILTVRQWPQKAKHEVDKMSNKLYAIYGRNVMSAQTLEVSPLGVETVLGLERDAVSLLGVGTMLGTVTRLEKDARSTVK